MFERFTERARQVVVLAQEEARALRHNYIGTEHLLLGLLREEQGIGARVLESLGATLDGVRAQVAEIVGQGEDVVGGQLPFAPRGKRVLDLALREALAMGHNWIGTEHVLLGLVRENDGVAMQILLDRGLSADRIRDEVVRMLGGPPPAGGPPPPPAPWPRPRRRRQYAWSSERPSLLILVGWLLFAVALGIGILIGWLIWD